MIISEVTIQKIKDEAEISKIIGEYIKLEKKGANFIGLCPFHADSNPSLTVSSSKKIYKCFSCGASGNVITFVQNFENVSFPKAVQIVGEKCGITVELDENTETSQNLDKYYQLMQNATNFYEFYLRNTEEGKDAIKYLYKRKLNDEIIKRFRIGLAPKETDLLYKTLLNNKFQALEMIEAGVVRSSESKYFDVFRNRIMFPIEDLFGNIVGFSGRIYQDKKTDESKYVNSSENILFKKSNILYNYHDAQNEVRIKDEVYVFEGFMDVIAAYRAGINHAVATMGTSLTQNQIVSLKKATDNIIVCYDGDRAGIEATKKAILHFLNAKCNVRAVLLPEGIDPDEYINEFGETSLRDFLTKHTLNGIDYLYEAEKKDLRIMDIATVETFKKNIFRYLQLFKSNVIVERYLKKLSEDIEVSIDSLKEDYHRTPQAKPIVIEPPKELPQFPKLTNPDTVKKRYSGFERGLIYAMYHDKEICQDVEKVIGNKYVDKDNLMLFIQLYDYYGKHEEMSDDFLKQLSDSEKETLSSILSECESQRKTVPKKLISRVLEYQVWKDIYKLKDDFEEIKDEDRRQEMLIEFSQLKSKIIIFKDKE